VRVAESAAADVRRNATADALDAWISALAAVEQVKVERVRTSLDDVLVRIARVRKQAGVAGDAELALATVLAADGRARLQQAQADTDATLVLLKSRLGLPASAGVELAGRLEEGDEPLPLEALLARLPRRADVVQAAQAVPAADAERKLQSRLALPVPRLLLGAGRENDEFARAGVDLPLPVYQRNQTSRAVAAARVETSNRQSAMVHAAAEAELRAAYARYAGARAAWQTLSAALPAVSDVEQLANRAYELGSVPLASAVVSRREAAAARESHLDALVTLARARVALEHASGGFP
jgi:cobalt-zinc-cadmium efflux system outer membrane protein